jgi:hypothetical protein
MCYEIRAMPYIARVSAFDKPFKPFKPFKDKKKQTKKRFLICIF